MPPPAADGFQMVAISPNVPGSVPHGMNGDFSRMTIMSSTEPAPAQGTIDLETGGHQFVKTKRKRLSKACENCHKSKRRCDGTAPCSNCYFASKSCVYLDKDGKPVPAPRAGFQEVPVGGMPQGNISTRGQAAPALSSNGQIYPTSNSQRRQAEGPDTSAKRVRAEAASPTNSTGSVASPQSDAAEELSAPDLDEAMTIELVNLFFTHCNPHRLIFHKPTFSTALAADQVPAYLLYAICALAAPWSAEMRRRAKEQMPRLAGVPFFLRARKLMFDDAGHLLSPPTLATAQALCLLEMHEVAASHSWTLHYRYFDLAMQFLEGTLQVTQPDEVLAASVPPGSMREFTVERECVRRCFWVVQTMFLINGIYTYRPLRPRTVELVRQVRLPVDENSFELARITSQPEYLHTPAPRNKYASQFGHVCRVLSLYQSLQAAIAREDSSRAAALASCRQSLDMWLASIPEHFRYSEENLLKQITMHETSSNTGPWCFCFVHTLHPCYLLDLYEAEGTLQAQPTKWIQNQLKAILDATGNRAKNSILSGCTLWTYSKYFPHDTDVKKWDEQFASLWGYSVAVVADHWRATQLKQRDQIGRTYPVEGVPQREAPPAFVASESESSPESRAASIAASPPSPSQTQVSSARSSPRERPLGAGAAQGMGIGGGRVVRGLPSGPSHARSGSSSGIGELIVPSGMNVGFGSGGNGGMARLRPQQSLPSLKASGLLDSWKPPTEAFAQAMSISRDSGHAHSQSLGKPMGAVPVGLNWLNGPQQ